AAAPEVMIIGWGEGLDEAARYLNARPEGEQLRAITWFTGMFAYFFEGQIMPTRFASELPAAPEVGELRRWLSIDYAVLYVNQWQRQMPMRELTDYFADLTPEKVIRLNGVEYARIYNLQRTPPPEFLAVGRPRFTDWGGAIRLVAYELPTEAIRPGEPFPAVFHFQGLRPIDRDLNVLVRVVGADGREWARDEGWPQGKPTSTWEERAVWRDGHELTLPPDAPAGYYRVELSFYDPATLEHLTATDARSGAALGDTLVVEYVTAGEAPAEPAHPLEPPALIGEQVRLLGAEVRTAGGELLEANGMVEPGERLQVRLFWEAMSPMETNLTGFVHLVGPGGQLAAQRDQEPLGGFLPTSLWRPRQVIADDYELLVPDNAPAGEYELRAGMYDATTGLRLQVSDGSRPIGDFVGMGTLAVR
ncbi:MAG TPA: hypothetical protein VER55_08885, partial [Ardenticatenaceae bacterium]|nr:hypothetical protein [Ardenticatenaceae bacterium]